MTRGRGTIQRHDAGQVGLLRTNQPMNLSLKTKIQNIHKTMFKQISPPRNSRTLSSVQSLLLGHALLRSAAEQPPARDRHRGAVNVVPVDQHADECGPSTCTGKILAKLAKSDKPRKNLANGFWTVGHKSRKGLAKSGKWILTSRIHDGKADSLRGSLRIP